MSASCAQSRVWLARTHLPTLGLHRRVTGTTSELESLSDSLRQSCIRSFCNSLSAEEAQLYKASTVASTLIDEIKQADKEHEESSKPRKVLKAIMPFIDGIQQYGAAMDVLANASDMLSPIWGAIRVVLHLGKQFGEYFEKLGQMLEDIGHLLIRIPRYTDLYPENETLRASIRDIYQGIFRFCFDARHVFRVGKNNAHGFKRVTNAVSLGTGLRLLWKPFQIQFGAIKDQLATQVTVMEKEVDLTEKEVAKKERQTDQGRWVESERIQRVLSRFIDDESVAKVNAWLAPVNVVKNQQDALSARHEKTGSWFLQGEEFKRWLDTDNSFLWLNGIVGSGKTILTSCIIDYLDENIRSADVGLAYFYFDHRDTQKQQPSQLLGTLLATLAKQSQGVFENVRSFFIDQQKLSPVFTASFDELRSRFSSFLGQQNFQTVMIVVDALDEARKDDWECIVDALKSLHRGNLQVKILLTSRNELLFQQKLESLPTKTITAMDVSADIESWIAAEVSSRIAQRKLKIKTPALEKQIRETLVKDAKGMFQWAKCQLDALCKPRNEKDIRKALKALPGTLPQTYMRILERVPASDVEKVRNVLCWLVRGTNKINLAELSHAVAIDPEDATDCFDFDAVDTYSDDILDSLGGLVTVSQEVISLAHFSVEEFLVSDDLRNKDSLGTFWVGSIEVDSQLARSCLRYLCYDDFAKPEIESDGQETWMENYPFYPYAAECWAELAHRSEVDGHQDQRLVELSLDLLMSKGAGRHNFDLWVELLCSLRPANTSLRYRRSSALTPVLCAASFGLTEVLETLLEECNALSETEPSECEQNDGLCPGKKDVEEAFKAATSNGHSHIVQLLIAKYTAVPQTDNPWIRKNLMGQGLYNAAAKGHLATVSVLLDNGAEVNHSGGKDGTALQAASLEARIDIVRLLLDRGADHTVTSGRYGTPLSSAAEKGHLTTCSVLLEKGADPKARGGWYASPLSSAIVGQNSEIVRLLIDRGADVNTYGGKYGYPLAAAASFGRNDLIRLLVDNGARVNDENDKTSDALYAACKAGHLATVNMLLDLGADVDAKGGPLRNALVVASSKGHVDVVKKLLQSGADIEVDSPARYGNGLQHAAENGHDDTVKCLAEAGIDPNDGGGDYGSALARAASNGHDGTINMLCDHLGVSVQDPDCAAAADALVAATMGGYESTIELLVQKGADPARRGGVTGLGGLAKGSCSPIQAAAADGDLKLVRLFLDLGVKVRDTPSDTGKYGTALMAAIDTPTSSLEVVQLLVDHGADVNQASHVKCDTYAFPLQAAVRRSNTPVVKLLLEKHADVNFHSGRLWSALQVAASHEDGEIMEILIQHGADINLECLESDKIQAEDGARSNPGPMTALQTASWFGHLAHVRRLVELGAKFAYASADGKVYSSALQMACRRGYREVIVALLDHGANINEKGLERGTPLQAACIHGDIDIVELMLDRGADPDGHDVKKGSNGIIGACVSSRDVATKEAIVRLLVKRGADINVRLTGPIQYSLHMMQVLSKPDLLKVFIDLGADLNVQGGQVGTALTLASGFGKHTTVMTLLEHGADPNITGGMWHSPMQAAFRSGFYLVIGALHDAGASVNLHGHGIGRSVMGIALGVRTAQGGQGCCQTLVVALVEMLKFDMNARYGFYGFALQNALMMGRSPELLVHMLKAGADVNMIGGRTATALTAAAWRGRVPDVDLLLENGADPTIGNERYPNAAYGALRSEQDDTLKRILEVAGNGLVASDDVVGLWGSPMCLAAYSLSRSRISFLEEAGAAINPPVPSGLYGTPLQASVISNIARKLNKDRNEAFRYLLKQGADIHARGGRFGSALGAAVLHADVEYVKTLLERGAKANDKGLTIYYTPLQAAAARGAERIAELLLEHGADVNSCGGKYWTPLQAACANGNLYLVEMLIENRAEVNVRGGRYGCALHAAAINGHEDVAYFLVHQAKAAWGLVDRQRTTKGNRVLDKADGLLKKVRDSSGEELKQAKHKRGRNKSYIRNTASTEDDGDRSGSEQSLDITASRWAKITDMSLYELHKRSLLLQPTSTIGQPTVSLREITAILTSPKSVLAKTSFAGSPQDAEKKEWEALSWVVPGVIGPESTW